jgi:hypothetical protein
MGRDAQSLAFRGAYGKSAVRLPVKSSNRRRADSSLLRPWGYLAARQLKRLICRSAMAQMSTKT